MRARLAFLVAAIAIVVAVRSARSQDLAPPTWRPAEEPKAAPKLTKAPAVLKAVEPVYPPEALAARISGDVTMTIDIDATGHVTKVEATKPAGHGFDEAARDAVMQYLFSPAEVDGKPSPIRIGYTLHFVPKQVAMSPDGGAAADAGPQADAGAGADGAAEAAPSEPPAPPPPPDVLVATGRL